MGGLQLPNVVTEATCTPDPKKKATLATCLQNKSFFFFEPIRLCPKGYETEQQNKSVRYLSNKIHESMDMQGVSTPTCLRITSM